MESNKNTALLFLCICSSLTLALSLNFYAAHVFPITEAPFMLQQFLGALNECTYVNVCCIKATVFVIGRQCSNSTCIVVRCIVLYNALGGL